MERNEDKNDNVFELDAIAMNVRRILLSLSDPRQAIKKDKKESRRIEKKE